MPMHNISHNTRLSKGGETIWKPAVSWPSLCILDQCFITLECSFHKPEKYTYEWSLLGCIAMGVTKQKIDHRHVWQT